MKYSAIILTGGFSKRFGGDKCLTRLLGKPLICYVFNKVVDLVDEVLIVVSSKGQLEEHSRVFGSSAKLVLDEYNVRSPLVGVVTGFKKAAGEYSVLLPCDTPLISEEVISLLLDSAPGHDAVVPRWPNGYVEPLQAVYKTKAAYASALDAFRKGKLNLRAMITGLEKVLYLSTKAVRSIDTNLHTFFNVNDVDDLREAEIVLTLHKKDRR